MPDRRARVRFVAIALTALLPAAVIGAASGQASAAATPSIRLVAGTPTAEIDLYRGGRYDIHVPVYLASVNGPFELWAQRATYDDPVSLSQTTRDAAGDVVDTQTVDGVPEPNMSGGLPDFLNSSLTKRNGTPIKDATSRFCPNSYSQQRLDDSGPAVSPYPEGCWASPFTRGAVWGIAEGWATGAPISVGRQLRIDEGTYKLTVSITDEYRAAFGIADEDATVTIPATVTKVLRHSGSSPRSSRTASAPNPEESSMPITVPPDSALPDIEALPAWGMFVENRKKSGRSYLNFGATAWNAGPGILAVEGFRDPASTTMDAFQYFYEDGDVVGKVDAGALEYDNRDGHDHWHFRDFAAYSLLDHHKVKVLDSGKEAFCLAPTDPIDLTVDGAEWRPWLTDLNTACGEEGSLWIREVLQTGWGDTYAQYRPGQSFEITDLPNGKYFVQVRANPDGKLLETSAANNEALRKIYLRGKPGERRVVVPPVGLVDSEGGDCGPFC